MAELSANHFFPRPLGRRAFISSAAAAGIAAFARDAAALAPASGKYGVSLMMWTYKSKQPLAETLPMVKALGIEAVELVNRLAAKDNAEVAAKCEELGLKVANVDAGTAMYGPKAALTKASERPAIMENVKKGIENAKLFKTDTLLMLSGRLFEDIPRAEQRKSLVDGLKEVMKPIEDAGLQAIIEPLNNFDHKGYYLTSMYEACEIIREVGSPRLKILFDIYHTQMQEGNLIKQITDNIGIIGHFHVADVPGRHEPGTGEINYAMVYEAIAKTAYSGFIGMEYLPQDDHDKTLAANREFAMKSLGAA